MWPRSNSQSVTEAIVADAQPVVDRDSQAARGQDEARHQMVPFLEHETTDSHRGGGDFSTICESNSGSRDDESFYRGLALEW